MFFKGNSNEAIVGPAIAAVLPDYGKPWFRVKHLLQLNLLMLVPLLGSSASGYDSSLLNGLQSVTSWQEQYNYPEGGILGLINASVALGGLLGLPLGGTLTDYIGRKRTLAIGTLGLIVGTIIQATSKNLAQLIASRFVLGFLGMLTAQPAPLLIAELSYPTHRGSITSLYNTFYYTGGILASWTVYGCNKRSDSWSWRIPTILQAGYPIVQLMFMYWVPESPRWLVSKGRMEEARAVLVKYHGGGDEQCPLVDVEISEILAAIEAEEEAKQTKWSSLISTPGNRRRLYIALTVGIAAQWNGLGVISYYLTLVLEAIGITSSNTQTLINGILQIFEFISAVSGALLVDVVGRRPLFIYAGCGMLVSYIVWTACSATFDKTGSAAAGKGVLGFIFIFAFHYNISYMPLVVSYSAEIFPYSLRAKGFTILLLVVYISLALACFCNPIAMDNLGWKYYIFYCVLLVFITLNSYFFYPETKGRSLEEVAELFDGPAVMDIEVASVAQVVDSDEKMDAKPEVQHIESFSS